jgi:carboxyl-terminal processing protease
MKNLHWIIGIVLLGSYACDPKEDPVPDPSGLGVKSAIFESMSEWYLWNEELPSVADYSKFDSNEELLEAIKFKPLDRFSYLTTQEEFNNSFVGKNAGHGFGYAFGGDGKLYISFVFEESPAGKDGWKRGWEITHINGKPISEYQTSGGAYDFKLGEPDPGVTNTFTFKLPDGKTATRSNVKAEYQSNSVLEKKIFDLNGKKVGYWAYQSFKATAGLSPAQSKEVKTSMEFFQNSGIQDLIIDLRYNGGGSVAVAEQIVNNLIQASNSGKLMYVNKYNKLKSSLASNRNFAKIGSINLNRVIFITSRGSASASELVINILDAYLDVVLIGDNTYGKPVGSFPLSPYNKVLRNNNVELVPITFAIANAEGKADYFEGFPADFAVGDSPQYPWGDERDLRVAAALNFIQDGNVSGRMLNTYYKPKWEMIDDFKGLRQEFPAY